MVNKNLKRVNEKHVLFGIFILLAILVIGSLLVMKSKLGPTGFVSLDGCDGDWTCDDWTACVDETQTRTCTSDTTTCDSPQIESRACTVTCTEDWICDDWTACVDETQTRTCTDANTCGTEENKPEEFQSCMFCGDGNVDEGEECDDGNEIDDDACTNFCLLTFCGDGVVQSPNGQAIEEICDGDVSCTTAEEYVGVRSCTDCITIGEDCTTTESCGDNIVNGDEVCDDGVNDGSYDSCMVDCSGFGPYCGDAIINGAEECDDGDNNGEYDYCLADCSGDGPSCGDGTCDAEEDCSSCDTDCACNSGYSCVSGACQEDDTSSDDDTSAGVTGATVDDMVSSCVSNWECGEWTECVGGTQTRECTDTNNCVTPTENLNPMSLPCEGSKSPETSETCFDGMKNQDEKGIDCGGVCEKRCSFFTIMGNAVNVPINSSKQFIENNKAISFSILGIIVLAVSWIVCVKVFLKKKNIFFFLKDFHLSNSFAFLRKKKKANMNNTNP